MELTKDQREAIDSIADWHKWLVGSIIHDQPREVPMKLRWLRESVSAACDAFGVDEEEVTL